LTLVTLATPLFSGLLGLLSGYAIASPFNEGDERSNIKPEDAIELLVTCEASFPLLSLRWDDRDNAKAAETASAFLNVPTPSDHAQELAILNDSDLTLDVFA
jgi:hypothetical protein